MADDRTAIENIIALLPEGARADALAAFRSQGATTAPTQAAAQVRAMYPAVALRQAAPAAPVSGGQPVADPTQQPPATGALGTLAPAAPQAAPAAPLGIGSLDPSNPAALLQNAIRLQQQYEGQAETGLGSKYDAAEAALRQQRQQARGLSAADLMKLSAAFFSPTRTPGFGGMMSNVMPVLGDITSTREELIKKYPQQLLAIQQQREDDLRQARQAGLNVITPLAEKLAEYGKPRAIRSAIDPTTGLVKNLDTGEIITAPGIVRITPDDAGTKAYAALPKGTTYFDVKNGVMRTK